MFDSYEGRQRLREWKGTAFTWGGIIATTFALRLIYLAVKPGIVSAYEYLPSDATSRFFMVVGILAAGVGLFYFRKHARFWYGIVEVGFGLMWAWAIAEHAGEPNPRLDLIALMGVLFLVVRGLDNCAIDLTERRRARDAGTVSVTTP